MAAVDQGDELNRSRAAEIDEGDRQRLRDVGFSDRDIWDIVTVAGFFNMSNRVAGQLAAEVLDLIGEHVIPGVRTEELDRICREHIVNVQRATPANVNYRGYPKTLCTSVNHVV